MNAFHIAREYWIKQFLECTNRIFGFVLAIVSVPITYFGLVPCRGRIDSAKKSRAEVGPERRRRPEAWGRRLGWSNLEECSFQS